MRSLMVFLSAMTLCGVAHAELLAREGAKGTLSVQYEYSAIGSKEDKDEPADWRVQRTIKWVVPMVADAPSQTSSLRPAEAADGAATDAKLRELQKTMTPTVGDMMKIAERCNDDDACIERALQAYGETMDKPTLEKGRVQAGEINAMRGPRYQRWQPVSLQGTYTLDETYRSQKAGPACASKPRQRCTREETRKGAGVVPRAASPDTANAATVEVDNVGKNLLLKLPTPVELSYTRQLTSDFPAEKSGNSSGKVPPIPGPQEPITVPLAGDLRAASGTHSYKIEGKGGEGGTVKVTWQFTLQK